MDQSLGPKFLRLHELAREDREYQELLEEYETVNARLLAVLPTLNWEQLDAVTDYLGLFGSMHTRMLELALQENDRFS